jgi:hypothetical protein
MMPPPPQHIQVQVKGPLARSLAEPLGVAAPRPRRPRGDLSDGRASYIGCAICVGTLSRPVELGCGHTFCWVCLANAPRSHACPLCHVVHILDPKTLRERRDSYRQGYRAWRQGKAFGARGEVGNVKRPGTGAVRNFAAEKLSSSLEEHANARREAAGAGAGGGGGAVGGGAVGGVGARAGAGGGAATLQPQAPDPIVASESNPDLSIAEILSGMDPHWVEEPPVYLQPLAEKQASPMAHVPSRVKAVESPPTWQQWHEAEASTGPPPERGTGSGTAAQGHASRLAASPAPPPSPTGGAGAAAPPLAQASRLGGAAPPRQLPLPLPSAPQVRREPPST